MQSRECIMYMYEKNALSNVIMVNRLYIAQKKEEGTCFCHNQK